LKVDIVEVNDDIAGVKVRQGRKKEDNSGVKVEGV
jgi:hypothetical protein